MHLLILMTLFLGMNQLGATFANAQTNETDESAIPSPSPPLQVVNTSNAQMNNNLPVTQARANPDAGYLAEQHALQQQQQEQQLPPKNVDKVQLPYPLPEENRSH